MSFGAKSKLRLSEHITTKWPAPREQFNNEHFRASTSKGVRLIEPWRATRPDPDRTHTKKPRDAETGECAFGSRAR